MQFIHTPYQPGDTVAAIATPLGEGGIAIVRISGHKAIAVAAKMFSGPVASYKSHTAHYGQVLDMQGKSIDSALLLVMLGKRSFTGEDTVEIHCHGGSLITRKVLETAIQAGARAAQPGEFSFKAFMSGKIDLAQAEAIQELICAKNERAAAAAESQLRGALSTKIKEFQTSLVDTAAILEAWVDFPEEGLEFATLDEICGQLSAVCQTMRQLEATFHDGRIIHEGLALCLIGSPNAGKSSLMNALLDKERAIVSHIPGTTRDLVEDQLRLNGLNFKIIDTAGIRDSADDIELEGIRRTKIALSEADLVLAVIDASQPLSEETLKLLTPLPPQQTIVVWNKIDLPHELPALKEFPHQVQISAKQRQGLAELKALIDKVVWKAGPPENEELLLTSARHKEGLSQAIQSCQKVIEGLQTGISPEFIAFDMRQCLRSLGTIIGSDITEDILTAIFSKFCIGK